ncbi:MAG: type I 3-dehydroquinate dehydratase [Bacteroidales bacterium]|nr:type I 3-dehydroquinate dehydratase [Bacteroidales bacterium]
MICTSIQNKNYEEIIQLLGSEDIELAEIRLDLCTLNDEEIKALFSESDIPLVATCRISKDIHPREAERRLALAIESGAHYADLEIEAPANLSKAFQKMCLRNGTEIIRSYHNYEETPDNEVLQMALARCFRYGADIAKVVTTCHNEQDCERIMSMYSIVLEDQPSLQGKLIAFGMGEAGRNTRLQCLKRGAPFSYACTCLEEATAPGQWTSAQMSAELYKNHKGFYASGLKMPASKSFAQRAILAAALAEGTSELSGYTPCGDTDAAIAVAKELGANVNIQDDVISITGISAHAGGLSLDEVCVGESGLLTRLMIPVLSVLNDKSFVINGHGTLPTRALSMAPDIMAAHGVLLSNKDKKDSKEVFVPLKVKGSLVPGNADVPGSGGSQIISGLLMALPLCAKDSHLFVSEPKSIPYMYITLDVLRHFGIQTRSEMEGDAQMLEEQDWSYCTGINFQIKGGQHYRAASFKIESDWSAAAAFLAAGAIFGSVEIEGLEMDSLQADLSIVDILVEAGAVVSQLEDNTVCVTKAPLEAFETDLNNAPDLFPVVAVLAAFCAGESSIAGVGRLVSKESNRAEAILQVLEQMGVEARIEGDDMFICGESLSSRLLSGRMLRGGQYSSRHDHRMVMALKLASIATESPIVIDDEACVGKSFPGFLEMFTQP